jgi:hypothetical protein
MKDTTRKQIVVIALISFTLICFSIALHQNDVPLALSTCKICKSKNSAVDTACKKKPGFCDSSAMDYSEPPHRDPAFSVTRHYLDSFPVLSSHDLPYLNKAPPLFS